MFTSSYGTPNALQKLNSASPANTSLGCQLPECLATSLYDAVVLMFIEDVGSIYVTNEGYLAGVISRKDLLRNAIGGTDLHKVPIGVIMTRMPNLIYVTKDETVLSAAIKIMEHEIDSIPVVEEAENNKYLKVIGRISKTTITRIFVELGNNF